LAPADGGVRGPGRGPHRGADPGGRGRAGRGAAGRRGPAGGRRGGGPRRPEAAGGGGRAGGPGGAAPGGAPARAGRPWARDAGGRRRGWDVLRAALADAEAPDLPLLVVGQPGWGGVDPLAEATRLGARAGQVRVLGRIPDADLAVVLSRATVLAAPSRAEGVGLPLLVAMAAGVPVGTSGAPP